MTIRLRRVYDRPTTGDGVRILVDRLWPRGLTKAQARVDAWFKELAPSTALRRWFAHDESKFREFRIRYLEELETKRDLVRAVLTQAGSSTVTLLFGARDPSCNHAVVLRAFCRALERGSRSCARSGSESTRTK